MKIKLILTALLSYVFYLLSSQIPQGFNYQAIARDGSGNILANKSLPVRITLQTLSDGGTTIWEEEHLSVESNKFGLISLVVGTGNRIGGVPKFSDIDWNAQTLYLKTSIRNPGPDWTVMGTSQVWSVPYSMVAKDVEGPITKLGISGTTSSLEEALFEVKNKDGQTIFAVYNEGVRVYVDDGAKGSKGGFAVGGFGLGKAEPQKYLYVDADSIRAYIGPNGKASKGGFAVGGFNLLKAPAEEYLRVTSDSTRIYVNENTKAAKGGFAVGGFNTGKSSTIPFVSLTSKNYFIGHNAGMGVTSGLYNSFIGYEAGKANKGGNFNIFIGYQSGLNHLGPSGAAGGELGSNNCYLGYQTGYLNVYGDNNTLIGYSSGWNNKSSNNTFLGSLSGFGNTSGYSNTFIGTEAGRKNTTGDYNVFLGRNSGVNIDVGDWNTFIGTGAGANIRSGEKNVVIGSEAMSENLFAGSGTGSSNIIIGYRAGYNAHNSDSNIFIGTEAGINETGSNLLYIDNNSGSTPLVYGNFTSKDFRINGDIEYTGAIGTVSDLRLKKNITGLDNVLQKLDVINGVYFEWNKADSISLLLPEGRQVGIIAQDVERVYPEMVMTNDQGYKMVDYAKLTPVLLEAVKEQQKQIDELRVIISSLTSKRE